MKFPAGNCRELSKSVTISLKLTCWLLALFLLASPFAMAADKPVSEIQTVELTGTFIKGGAECRLFEADSGEKYTLLGDLKGYKDGDRARIYGEFAEISFCMQGKTISVKKIERVR